MIKLFRLTVFCLASLVFLASCNRTGEPQADTANTRLKALAIVNGKVISEQEVMGIAMGRRDHEETPEAAPDRVKTVLNDLVQKELAAQQAVELGFDKDPRYTEQLDRITAQMNAFKRDKLAELFEAREIIAKAIVSEAEVEKFFSENESSIRSEMHILKIQQRSEEHIKEITEKLASGMSFDEVAAEQFPNLPSEISRPWDLGYLKWEQIPEAWADTLANMQPGDTSPIIRGQKRRYWVLQLVDRRPDEHFDLTSRKGRILQILQDEKVKQRKEQAMQALNADATIVYPQERTR